MYTKQMTTAFFKKRVIIIIAFIMTFLTLSIKANADSAYINQADYPILKQDSLNYSPRILVNLLMRGIGAFLLDIINEL